jgi:hypothetical protein
MKAAWMIRLKDCGGSQLSLQSACTTTCCIEPALSPPARADRPAQALVVAEPTKSVQIVGVTRCSVVLSSLRVLFHSRRFRLRRLAPRRYIEERDPNRDLIDPS